LTQNGAAAPVGKYKIVVSAKAAEGSSVAATPLVKSEVTGVDLGGEGGGTLITTTGEVAFNAIIGVYDPKKRSGVNEPSETTSGATEAAASTSAAIAETAENVAATAAVAEELL
jgi:hypothetical protein